MVHRRWSPEEMAKSTNSIVLDMLTITESSEGGDHSSDVKRGPGRRPSMQEHPFYDVIYEVELLTKEGSKGAKRKLDLIVKCPLRDTGRSKDHDTSSPARCVNCGNRQIPVPCTTNPPVVGVRIFRSFVKIRLKE